MKITQAVILAGGRGTRLKPFTDHNPKPMIPIKGRPFLEYLIDLLKSRGIKEVVILTGYKGEKIKKYFSDGSRFGVSIKYSYTPFLNSKGQETISGTRLKNAKKLLKKTFLLMYCDNYWPLSLQQMELFYESQKTLAMVTIYNNKDGFGEYGFENNMAVSKSGTVLNYDKTRTDTKLNGVDIGFFIFNKKIVDLIPDENCALEKIIPILIEKKQLSGFTTDQRYYTITNISKVEQTTKFLEDLFNQNKVIFLDRDGVINKNAPPHQYITSWGEFQFLPGAVESLKLLRQRGYYLIMVSNQQGVSKGLMTEEDLKDINQKMQAKLQKLGAKIDAIYYCPHHSESNCDCRKPKPGMLLQAASDHQFDVKQATFIGDSASDEKAALSVGCQFIKMQQNGNLFEIVTKFLSK